MMQEDTLGLNKAQQRVAERRAELVNAMAVMLRNGELPVTLSSLAKVAGMSPATAYRYFQSLEEVAQAYLVMVMTKLLDYARNRPERGTDLLRTVSRYWVGLVLEHGQILVQIRSRRGFFDRLNSNTISTVRGHEARKHGIYGMLEDEGLPVALQEDAAMLYNTMFDPRDILDLINLRGIEPDQVTDVLIHAFIGAVRGWHVGIASSNAAEEQNQVDKDGGNG